MKNLFLLLLGFAGGLLATGLYLEYRNIEEPQTKAVVKKETATFSIESAPSVSLKGNILSRTGSLQWESRTATAPAELTGTTSLSQGERIITENNSKAVLEFDRFGKITMEEESDLSFPQTFPVDFVVNQRSGKVGYELTGNIPLSIRMRNALVTKTTGKIEIEVTPDDPIILISTIKDTATIGFNDTENTSRVFTLREGQIYEYNSDERTAVNSSNK